MRDVLYLAWQYVLYHRTKSLVLLASIALIVYLPVALNMLVNQSSAQLTKRAGTTPLLVGSKGSSLELVLRSLYFQSDIPESTAYSELLRVQESGLADGIPLHCQFRTQSSPIVGTSLEYFEYRQLPVADGRLFGMLGECVVGSRAALAEGVAIGDAVISAPESFFNLAGVYPLKMKVVGILEPTGTPDDSAVFVDVKTAWVIAGLAHGHDDLSKPESQNAVLRTEGNTIVANASVMQYNEITPENVSSFHFHGERNSFPITSVIALPFDQKSDTLLQGRYLSQEERVQIVRPAEVMSELLETVLTVRRYILLAMALVALATLAAMSLVFTLSYQLRKREMETMAKIGAAPVRIASLVSAEVIVVLVLGSALAMMMTGLTYSLAPAITRWLVQLA